MPCSARYPLSFLLTVIFLLVDLCLAGVLAPTVLSHTNEIPSELFNSLSELSRLVDISYCVGSSGIQPPFQCLKNCDRFKGFELVTTWDTGPLLSDSCGYIALSHPPFAKRIIVAFRGTHSISNILADLSLHPQEYVPYIGDPEQDGNQAGTPQRRCENCTVHAGFLNSWHNARPTVLHSIFETREHYPDYELVLVGHSLGGAVAALAGIEMQLRGWRPQVTTFGEPRVGNEQFVKFFDETFALKNSKRGSDGEDNRSRMSIRRVTHVNDPVPLLPFDVWGYKMHAGEIFISKQDLPVSKSDLTFCDGDQDQRCIAGTKEALALQHEGLDQRRYSTGDQYSTDQVLHSGSERSQYAIDDPDYDQDHSGFYSQWNPIPPEFRLWELLFSHRDYITHLGLCFPSPLLAVE